MPDIIEHGAQPAGTCPFALLGGVCLDYSISPKELDRIEVLDEDRESTVYKKVVLEKTASVQLEGASHTAAPGGTFTLEGTEFTIISVSPAGSRGNPKVFTIAAEEFPADPT